MSDKDQRKVPLLRFKGFTNDWEQRKWKDILLVNSGKDYKHLSRGSIPVYGTGGYMLSVDKELSNVDAIGIGRKGTIDHPQYLKAPFWTVDTLFFMTPKKDINIDFAFGLSQTINWKKYDESTGLPSLSKKSIDNISIKLPNYNEQIKIGRIISQIDNVLSLQRRKLNKLKSLRKGIKESTLPKNLKSPSASFENTGKIFRFSELFKRSSEKNDGSFSKDKVISVANMRWGTAPKNSSDDYMKTYFILRKGDIAFEGNRSKNYSFGRFIANDLEDGIVSHVFIVYRPKKELNLNYLKYYINDEQVMRTPLRMSTSRTTMMTNLVQKDIVKQKLLLPSIQEQNKLGELYKKVDALIQMNQLKLNRLNQLKQFLLQKLFV